MDIHNENDGPKKKKRGIKHLFIFISKRFMLVRVALDPEPIPETLVMRQDTPGNGWDTSLSKAHAHIHTYGQFTIFSPPACVHIHVCMYARTHACM